MRRASAQAPILVEQLKLPCPLLMPGAQSELVEKCVNASNSSPATVAIIHQFTRRYRPRRMSIGSPKTVSNGHVVK
jgi:hypothetical protein